MSIEDLFCGHIFSALDENNKPRCQKCGMYAEDYYRAKFDNVEDFKVFMLAKIFEDF